MPMKFFKSFLFSYSRFFIIGLAAIVAVEAGVLIYINNFYLRDNSEYKTSTISATSSSKAQFMKVSIDANAQSIVASYDRRYVAYQKDGSIAILDMTNGQKYTVDNAANMQLSYFKWVYNRDRLMVAEKKTDGYYCKLYEYDMKNKELIELRDNVNNSDFKISLQDTTDNITGIDVSTSVVKEYIKVTTQNKASTIWGMDVYGNGLQSLYYPVTGNIGAMQSLKFQDKLLYEDTDNGKVYMYGSRTALSIGSNTSFGLLGFDNNDNVYLAAKNGTNTKTVYCGSYDKNSETWSWPTTIQLDKEVSVSDIYVELNGTVYYNDTANSTIVKAWPVSESTSESSSMTSSSSQTSIAKASSSSAVSSKSSGSSSDSVSNSMKYDGNIIGVYQSGFLSLYNNQIIPYDFK
jgi:hypothetical protein